MSVRYLDKMSSLGESFGQIDIALFALIGLSGLFGLWRGIVKEVFSLASLIVATVVVRLYSSLAATQLEGLIDSNVVRLAISSAFLFISVMVFGSWTIALLQKFLTFTGLRLIDRVLGGAFGLARGVLILMVLIYFAEPFAGTQKFWLESSAITIAREAIAAAAEYLQPVTVPAEQGEVI